MPTGFRRALSILAIAAVALHTALWGATAISMEVAPVDPFSVICHSPGNVDAAAAQAPAGPLSTPSHACDHCNLCGSMPPPAASPAAVVGELLPDRLLHEPEPVSSVARAGSEVALKGARGPPGFA